MTTAQEIPIPVYQTIVTVDQVRNAWEEQTALGKHLPVKVGCVNAWIMMNVPVNTVFAYKENVKVCQNDLSRVLSYQLNFR